jgi:LacI family transcriptional regulator, fructose operon transcriptional repressor
MPSRLKPMRNAKISARPGEMMRAERGRKTTIYDIADATGASASTVSAVLNGTWKQRRIREETANHIRNAAESAGYSANLQARGLRKSRSGLIGMIVPLHDNRFFSGLSQCFEAEARERGLCPVIVSTSRDPERERSTVETLISYNVESIVITGATDPDALSRLCSQAGIRHINVDLPGKLASSVISDNHWGAAELTRRLIEKRKPGGSGPRNLLYFLGGLSGDYATASRIQGFRDVHQALIGPVEAAQINPCGYEPGLVEAAIRALYERFGGLPTGLFVNSTIAFEGVVRFLKTLQFEEFADCVIGCYDYDVFASFLHFPVMMVRQDSERLIGEAFAILDQPQEARPRIVEIRPELVAF